MPPCSLGCSMRMEPIAFIFLAVSSATRPIRSASMPSAKMSSAIALICSSTSYVMLFLAFSLVVSAVFSTADQEVVSSAWASRAATFSATSRFQLSTARVVSISNSKRFVMSSVTFSTSV